VYQTSMTDEVDFDLQSFRYVNIGRSRHRGLETGLQIESGPAAVFLNYALQDAVARTGDNAGNRLKAIPHHTISGGASAALPAHRLTLTGAVTHLGGMFLDDANTIRMPNWTRVDLQVAARVLGVEAFGEMRNVLGSRYHTTGYLDPGGSGATYLYPAAGRTFQLGVRSALR